MSDLIDVNHKSELDKMHMVLIENQKLRSKLEKAEEILQLIKVKCDDHFKE